MVLLGGGGLGAYQAGVHAGLAEAGVAPDWIAGVSIGAINATLIAGNLPERRVGRLREFWERVFNFMSAASSVAFGVPGFFTLRIPSPFTSIEGNFETLSLYDTRPLRATLEELVDFELINRKTVRLSLGSVNVRSGNSFDNGKTQISHR
jgi:NTE family protein